MKRAIVLLVLLSPAITHAQESKIPKAAWDDLAKDLGHLQAIAAQASLMQSQYGLAIREARITADTAPVRAGAKDDATVVTTLKQGAKVRVVGQADAWFAVEVPSNEKSGEAKKSGWASSTNLVLSAASTPEVATQPASFVREFVQNTIQRLTDEARQLKEKYESNQYFKISGFDVGVPGGLTVHFEFKK